MSNNYSNTVGKYVEATGAPINPTFIPSVTNPSFLDVSGNDLFVSAGSGAINKYNATTGALVTNAFVSGPNLPYGIAVSGGNLYVSNYFGGNISEYNATTGALINASLVTGVTNPSALSISGGHLYVMSSNSPAPYKIGEYDLATGAAINASLITGLTINSFTVAGNKVYTTNWFTGAVGEYDANTGATINANFITGLFNPVEIRVDSGNLYVTQGYVPEPSTMVGMASAAAILFATRRSWKRRAK